MLLQYSTYRDCSGQVHQRGQNTKTLPNMHHQWKLTDKSQNKVAMTHPQCCTHSSYIYTVSIHTVFGDKLSASLIPRHTETRTAACDVAVRTSTRTDRNKAYSKHTVGGSQEGAPSHVSSSQSASFFFSFF